MEVIINLFCISIIISIITDISGFPSSLSRGISYLLTKGKLISSQFKIKLFHCSLCQMTWVGLFYLCITNNFTLPLITFNMILAFLMSYISETLLLIKDLLIKINQLILNKLL